MEDRMFDYAIRHIRTQKIFNDDCYFDEWNETLRVNNVILLDKATVVDMAMCYIQVEMAYIINEYFSYQEEAVLAKLSNFPFDVYDYEYYSTSFERTNPYIHSVINKLKSMVDYIDEKYSSILGSYYYN